METSSEQPQAWMLDSREGDAYWSLGSLTILKATAENTNSSFSLIEERVPPGQSPPLHVHQSDDEMWYIIDGRVTFEVDGERFTATSGSTVFAPHGLPHSYITEEETDGSCSFTNLASNNSGRRLETRRVRGRFQMTRRWKSR